MLWSFKKHDLQSILTFENSAHLYVIHVATKGAFVVVHYNISSRVDPLNTIFIGYILVGLVSSHKFNEVKLYPQLHLLNVM